MCRDNSSANRHQRQNDLHTGAGSRDTTGQSYRTYTSSKKVIMQELPRRFILENVGQCPVEPTLEDLREALPGYHVTAFKTEALHFHAAARRVRVFILGIQRCITVIPPDQWPDLLTRLGGCASDSGPARHSMLPADDAYPRDVFAVGVASAEPEVAART